MPTPGLLPNPEPLDHERFRLIVPSDLARVGEAVECIAAFCFGQQAPRTRTRFRLCTVLAEAIANAMTYGNGGDPARSVTIEIELHAKTLTVAVSDEGNGFDPTTIPAPTGAQSREATRGRGLFMIRGLTDHVVFNERGNTICMTLPRG
jgi:serine/threonine-protein kinase RsbW